jgi:hypothetical protein
MDVLSKHNAAQEIYKKYQKEFDDLFKKYLEDAKFTQAEYDNLKYSGRPSPFIVGQTYKTAPTKPKDTQAAFTLFKDYFCQLQFIACKMQFIHSYKEWSLSNVEAELQELDRFIKSSHSVAMPYGDLANSYFEEKGIEIEFVKLESEYYNTHPISDDVWSLGFNSMAAMLYGKYILYYGFLKKERKLLLESRHDNAFSKQHPFKQLDMVLSFFANDDAAFPDTTFEEIQKVLSEKYNYLGYSSTLYEILAKLEKDEKIISEITETIDVGQSNRELKRLIRRFKITWEGRYFISKEKGGYQGKFNQENAENTRLENLENHQKNHRTWMTWLTVVLSVFAVLSVFLQSLEKFNAVFRIQIWMAFFLFLFGGLTAICIILLVKEIGNPKNKE